jgi:hypothetical protein
MRTFIITTAVNNTPVAAGFWATLNAYAAERKAKILVIPSLYKNPTAKRSKATRDRENRYAPEVLPHLVNRRVKLAPGLTLMGDVPVQPTAGNPLSGMEILAATSSAIVGHVTRQVVCVPTDRRDPRVLWTTAACTVPKYGKSRAGARAKEHHSVGALVVEVDRDGTFFVRHLCASRDGSFYDLGTHWSTKGVRAGRAAAVILGDIHVGADDPKVLAASKHLVAALKPQALVLHDVLDMSSRSHHRQSLRDGFDGLDKLVEVEVRDACQFLADASEWGSEETYVVRSNHDTHLERWLEECDPRRDPLNAPYYHRLWTDAYTARINDERWPNLFAMEAHRFIGEASLTFLGREDALRIAGCELAFHGDLGTNGSRGSIRAYARLGVKTVIGHSHTPAWFQGCVQVGVTGKLDMGYNAKPSTWAHAHCVVHPDGKRQLIFLRGSRYKGGQGKKGVK